MRGKERINSTGEGALDHTMKTISHYEGRLLINCTEELGGALDPYMEAISHDERRLSTTLLES